jgi:hypothetical protein
MVYKKYTYGEDHHVWMKCPYLDMGLTLWLKIFTFMFDIGSNGFIGDWCTMYRWGHNYNIISSVDHPGFKSDLATNDDVPQQYRGTGVEL